MCGFCTPGFIMASVALLEKTSVADARADPQGSRRQHLPVRDVLSNLRSRLQREGGDPWLSPNDPRHRLATGSSPATAQGGGRGGGSGRTVRAADVAATAPPADPKYHWPRAASVLGTHVKRLDGPDKVTGRAKYTFDISRPGMLYGRIVRSPHPHARIVSVDCRPRRKRRASRRAAVDAILPTRSATRSCSKATRSRRLRPTPKNTQSTPRGWSRWSTRCCRQ